MLFRQRYEEDLRHIGSLQAWLASLAVAAAFLLLPLVAQNYLVYNVTLFMVYSLVALALCLLVGYTGQVSLGHAGFFAAGAYTAGLVTLLGWPVVFSLPLSLLVGAALGLLIGVPALRLHGPYLAIATLGFGLAIQQLLNNWALVGASSGLFVERPQLAGLSFWNDATFYYFVLAVFALSLWLSFNLVRSHIGRAFVAVRDAELAAQTSGVSLSYYKILAFVLSAALTALAGSLYGQLAQYVTPESFNLLLSVKFLLMIVVGGLGFLPGAVLGAAFITGLEFRLSAAQNWSQLIYGAVVIVIMVLEPLGIYGRWLKIQRYWKSWPM
jgi:branched-chain amino acid transport system permease protein